MLPKRPELDKILKAAKEQAAKKAEQDKILMAQEAELKQKALEEKLENDVQELIKSIENDILSAIKQGKHSTFRHFGNGHTTELAWEMAVARMQKVNRDYNFNIKSDSLICSNYDECKEWEEPTYTLEITW